MMKKSLLVLVFVSLSLFFASFSSAFTRDEVIERGNLRCGVSTGVPGFSNVDGKGNWSGIDVDVCRAVAAAVLQDAAKVEYIPLLPKERATALLAGEIDILSRNFAWNLTRDSSLNMNFAAVTFFDLLGFLAGTTTPVNSMLELKEFSVCLQYGTGHEEYLAEYLQESGLKYKTIISDTPDQIVKDFEAGRCEVIIGGRAQLQGIRSKMADPAGASFLPEVIAGIPLGPAVRQGDDFWFDIVKWTVFAMINGEELGLTSTNIDSMVAGSSGAIQRFLGLTGIGGKGLGLADGWAYQVIKQVGNYEESFERNLGESSPLKLQRGLNNLWNKGGILYAPPLR
jgi:general L-amino acid transport system substrate-binding protein